MPGEQLLLINPRRRKRHKNPRRHRAHRRRHRNPHRRHARRRHRNPRMRHHRRRHRNPISMGGITSTLVPAAFGAAGGVALDFAYNFASPYVPTAISSIPYGPQLLKLAGAFGIGILARKFLGPVKGNAVMMGAVTVQLYNFLAVAVGGTGGMAGLGAYLTSGKPAPMAGLGSPNPAVYIQRPMGRMGRVGAYMNKPMSGLSGLPFAGLNAAGMEDFGDGM